MVFICFLKESKDEDEKCLVTSSLIEDRTYSTEDCRKVVAVEERNILASVLSKKYQSFCLSRSVIARE